MGNCCPCVAISCVRKKRAVGYLYEPDSKLVIDELLVRYVGHWYTSR